MSRAHARPPFVALALLAVVAAIAWAAPASAADTASISGSAWQDLDRDGIRDADEPAFGGHQVLLFSGVTLVDTASTAADGTYAFSGLAPGTYTLRYGSTSWRAIRTDWVPTTTGSVWPEQRVDLVDAGVADFGWRRIVTSSTLGLPLSSHTGPEGLRVESYTDAVHARTIHEAVVSGSLVGAEAPSVLVRFGHGDVSATATAIQSSGGVYTRYSATVAVTYVSWLDSRDETLFHEYGHAWAGYFSHLVQQDPALTGYLDARGLLGDERVNQSYGWNASELIAEDYRQLFGTPSAAAAAQTNRDIPPAAEVPGLAEYLAGTFRTAPSTEDPGTTDPGTSDPVDGGSTDAGGTDSGSTGDGGTAGPGKGGGKGGTDKTSGGGKGRTR